MTPTQADNNQQQPRLCKDCEHFDEEYLNLGYCTRFDGKVRRSSYERGDTVGDVCGPSAKHFKQKPKRWWEFWK